MNSVRLYARPSAATNRVRQLRLDHVRTEAHTFVKHRPRNGAEPMTGGFLAGESMARSAALTVFSLIGRSW
jgi:hypothetical protein